MAIIIMVIFGHFMLKLYSNNVDWVTWNVEKHDIVSNWNVEKHDWVTFFGYLLFNYWLKLVN